MSVSLVIVKNPDLVSEIFCSCIPENEKKTASIIIITIKNTKLIKILSLLRLRIHHTDKIVLL